jgi:hypothetical protein
MLLTLCKFNCPMIAPANAQALVHLVSTLHLFSTALLFPLCVVFLPVSFH